MKTLHFSIIIILTGIGMHSLAFGQVPVPEFDTAYFKSDHGTYQIPYQLINATLISTPLDLSAKTLFFEINATSDGQLTVELPRAIIDSKNGSQDKPYYVTADNIRSLGGPMRVLPEEISVNDVRIVQINFPRDTSEIGISGTYFVSNYTFIPQKLESPLKQFKSGIPISNIQCVQDLSLVIKAEDGTPACVKQESISKLILRGWMGTTSSLDQNNSIFGDFYQGIENDSGIVSIKNQTYYMMTATNTTYPVASDMTVQFHQVSFSFPYGSWATPGGVIIPFDMTFPDGTTETYGKVTKNPDGSGSGSGIGLGPGPSSNRTVTVLSVHNHPQAGVTLTEDQIKLLISTDVNTTNTQTQKSENTTLSASFEPCDTPYQQNGTGVAVLYMPVNSIGKVCVRYHNLNDFTAPIRVRIFEANNMTRDAPEITTWNDAENNTIPTGDSTIVYWIKTGNHTGFYGFSLFCGGLPLAVGYDNNSTLVASDFPYLFGGPIFCPMQTYDYHIDSLTGIGVKFIPPK